MPAKKALLVGINGYPLMPLRGCVNDAGDLSVTLTSGYGFAAADIRILPERQATRDGILGGLEDLARGAAAGDCLLFFFSGHGVILPSATPGGSAELLDVICPIDFNWSIGTSLQGADVLAALGSVPDGVNVTWISDCCHSGSLAAIQNPDSLGKKLSSPVEIAWELQQGAAHNAPNLGMDAQVGSGRILFLSACRRDEIAEDTYFDRRPNGAFSFAMNKSLRDSAIKGISPNFLVQKIQTLFDGRGFKQRPEVHGSEARKKTAIFT